MNCDVCVCVCVQDFDCDPVLKAGVKDLLEEMVCNSNLLPAEHKAAASILHVLTKEEETVKNKVDLQALLLPPTVRHRNALGRGDWELECIDIYESQSCAQLNALGNNNPSGSTEWNKSQKTHAC